jgi:hypothetical protein
MAILPRDITRLANAQVPGSNLITRDIYNARQRIRQHELNGHTPTQAFIRLLSEDEDIQLFVKESDDDRIEGVFWAYTAGIRLWRRFPQVLSFDNTYKTNRFGMPLFQITGLTPAY